jgi:hypothetical protein
VNAQWAEWSASDDPDQVDVAVTAKFWWSASNWRNRITVPLTFVPSGNLCGLTDNDVPLDIFGSKLMVHATDQRATAFCTDPTRFKFHVIPWSRGGATSVGNLQLLCRRCNLAKGARI